MRLTTPLPVMGSEHCLQDLRAAVLRAVLHHGDDAAHAGDEIHGAAGALDHLARHHPVGEVAVAATSRPPRMDRSMCPPRIMAKESALEKKLLPGIAGDGLLAGVDEVGVDLSSAGERGRCRAGRSPTAGSRACHRG
jgi:hypothetical protein